MNIEIANRLLAYRLANGMSQEALAEKLGVSRQAVSKWERAEAAPDTDNLIALAALYGVLIDELINGKGEPQVKASQEQDTPETDEQDEQNASTDESDINMEDGFTVYAEDGDKVFINKEGIRVSSADGDKVIINKNGVHIVDGSVVTSNDEDDDEEQSSDGPTIKGNFVLNLDWMSGATPILCTIAYLILGFTTTHGWAWGWLLFFLVPTVPSLVSAIRHRNPSNFAYPVFVTGLYLVAGVCYGRWHPEWIIFLTIPVYYIIADSIKKRRKSRK